MSTIKRCCSVLLSGFLTVTVATSVDADDPKFIDIGGGPSGGTYNVAASGLADLLKEEFPDSVISVQPGGAGPNLLRVNRGDAQLGITSGNNAWDAWHGMDPAPEDSPVRNVRSIMTFFPSAVQIWVPADSDIHSIKDLRDKTVTAGQPGETSWNTFVNLLELHGMTPEDIDEGNGNLRYLTWSEAHSAFRNGELDAIMWVSLYPHSTVLETETARELRPINLGEKIVQQYTEKHGAGFEPVQLSADLYKGMDEPITTLGTNTFLFTNAEASDGFVYRIADQIWSNLDRFQQTHNLLNYMGKDTVGSDMVVPLHPGAKRFFREHDIPVKTPALAE